MDDMVDLGRDTRQARHNFVASLIYHGSGSGQWKRLQEQAAAGIDNQDRAALLPEFPDALEESARTANRYLSEGLGALFGKKHRVAVEPAIRFLYRRIGTEKLMDSAGLHA
jgi:hypothetical protein